MDNAPVVIEQVVVASELGFIDYFVRGAQTIASLSIAIVSVYVFRWTRRRDKADNISSSWQYAQQMNIVTIQDETLRKIVEKIVYGQSITSEERSVADNWLYFYLNRVHVVFSAYQGRLMSEKRYREATRGTLCLICPQYERIKYLILYRGYEERFAKEVIERLGSNEIEPTQHWLDIEVEEMDAKISEVMTRDFFEYGRWAELKSSLRRLLGV